MKDTIIIDTDPGIDDALALGLAHAAQLPVKAITTVFGNTSIAQTTQNALTVLDILGWDVPVYRGATRALRGRSKRAQSHGENGLGGYTTIQSKSISKPALPYLIQTLNQATPASITIICLGPTTTIARIVQRYPELSTRIKSLVILGGVLGEKGNTTPYAEFNVYNDPHALKVCLNSECPVVLIPINICRSMVYTKAEIDSLGTHGKFFQRIASMYIDYYQNDAQYGGFTGGVMYDLLAISYILMPSLFKTKQTHVSVVTKSGKQYGKTFILPYSPNCQIVTQIDNNRMKKDIQKIFKKT